MSGEESASHPGIGVDSAVAKKGPVLAGDLDVAEVEVGDEDLLAIVRGLGDDPAERVGDEGSAPELEAGIGTDGKVSGLADNFVGGWRDTVDFAVEEDIAELAADAIDGADEDSVGDGVRALDGLPGVVLAIAEFGLFCGMPTDGGGIKEHFRAAQGGLASSFGIPLVPADQSAELPGAGVDRLEAEVAGREVKLLIIKGIVGYVHFAVDAGDLTPGGRLGIEDDGCVVVETGSPALEQGGDENNVFLADDGGEAGGGGAWDGLGQGEEGVVFALAKVLGAK